MCYKYHSEDGSFASSNSTQTKALVIDCTSFAELFSDFDASFNELFLDFVTSYNELFLELEVSLIEVFLEFKDSVSELFLDFDDSVNGSSVFKWLNCSNIA